MFKNSDEQWVYIEENYPQVTDRRLDEDHWDLQCPNCQAVRGFQVVHRSVGSLPDRTYSHYSIDTHSPRTIIFRCPVCKFYKQWIVLQTDEKPVRYFRVASIPNEGIEDIPALPEQPPSLRIAYKQAIRAMDANAHIAAAAMFRRALQVITREILKIKPGNLAEELKRAVGAKYDGVTITNDFSDNAYIIKEAGNQGAHPDADQELLDFTPEDSGDLQNIFMELVTDLFIVPKAQRQAKEDFLQRRKIKPR